MATRITANISAGVTLKPKFMSVMNADEYRGYASELLKTTNTTNRTFRFLNEDPNYYYYNQYHQNTDWKDLVYHTAMTQNYGINVEGGDAVASYNLSVGYVTQQSTLKFNDMDRLNIRFNTDISLYASTLRLPTARVISVMTVRLRRMMRAHRRHLASWHTSRVRSSAPIAMAVDSSVARTTTLTRNPISQRLWLTIPATTGNWVTLPLSTSMPMPPTRTASRTLC